MFELLQVSLVPEISVLRCWIRRFCQQICACWFVGWPIVCLADQIPKLFQAVLLPGNTALSLYCNILTVLRLYSQTFDLLHMQPSAKGSKSLNANQSGRVEQQLCGDEGGNINKRFPSGTRLKRILGEQIKREPSLDHVLFSRGVFLFCCVV